MANRTVNDKSRPARKKLRNNEFFNPKTKRYEYRYKDIFGKNRLVSSYRLESTDQVPKGKKSGKSLREKEVEINALLADNIDIDGSKLTLLEIVDKYLVFLATRSRKTIVCRHVEEYLRNCIKRDNLEHSSCPIRKIFFVRIIYELFCWMRRNEM